MKSHLGLHQDFIITNPECYKLSQIFESITGSDKPVSKISLFYWVDRYGDFTSKTDRQSRIIKAIFKNMSNAEQFEILNYINDKE
ncbi:MAG: hypothetical protein HOG49_21415 [Candidatus Scalindua sp.]|jgi:hypothetical protein|nr:hypothetical protein [Candidatus Scalindua sp.]